MSTHAIVEQVKPAFSASVCICTFNGAGRVPAVLRRLAEQTLPRKSWELLVIDNASSDGVGRVAGDWMERLFPGMGRVVREATAGVSFARRRAAAEARGDIVCFLDDDNVPAPDFVANAVRAFAARPRAAAMGGKVKAVWERAPSPLAVAVQDFALAICDRGDKAFRYDRNLGPVGAGLCIRAEVLRRIYKEEDPRAITGRSAESLAAGEDLAIGVLAWKLGGECWYEPSLVLQHLLPTRRMEKDYLMRLYEGIGRGQAAVRQLYDWKSRARALSALIGVKDLLRWLRGKVVGPRRDPAWQYAHVADDLHDLNQRLLWGRAMQALAWQRVDGR